MRLPTPPRLNLCPVPLGRRPTQAASNCEAWAAAELPGMFVEFQQAFVLLYTKGAGGPRCFQGLNPCSWMSNVGQVGYNYITWVAGVGPLITMVITYLQS